MELAESKGYRLAEQDLWRVVRLNRYTFADPETEARLKARYPLKHPESDPMAPPDAIASVQAGSELISQVAPVVSVDFDGELWQVEMIQLESKMYEHRIPADRGGAGDPSE